MAAKGIVQASKTTLTYMMVEIFELWHLDGFMQCFMSAVNWDFSDWMFRSFFFKDPYLYISELESLELFDLYFRSYSLMAIFWKCVLYKTLYSVLMCFV